MATVLITTTTGEMIRLEPGENYYIQDVKPLGAHSCVLGTCEAGNQVKFVSFTLQKPRWLVWRILDSDEKDIQDEDRIWNDVVVELSMQPMQPWSKSSQTVPVQYYHYATHTTTSPQVHYNTTA